MAALISTERDCDNGEDRISQLPEDILLTFVLPLGIKEAAKTSLISKRWRYLWAHRTHLDFNHSIVLPESDPNPINIDSFAAAEKNKYLNWVNQVVGLHCIPCIDTFKVVFTFVKRDVHHIDKWVTFALLKKVQNLQLCVLSETVVYTLRLDVLIKPSQGIGDDGINFLKTLHLSNINVSGDALEHLMSQCCLLERLYVSGSKTLVRLRVVGLSCKLKQLTISCCRDLEELLIDAFHLVYLEYGSANFSTNAVFMSMPMLVEANFSGLCFAASPSIFQQISHLAAQISTLYLHLMFMDFPTGVFPTFCNLKQLSMAVDGPVKFDLFAINQFLKACPTLRELKFEIAWHEDELMEEAYELGKVDLSKDEVEVVKKYDWKYFERMAEAELERTNLQNLKQLQIVGFSGYDADVELILFVVVLASNLETIVCDTTRWYDLTFEEVIEGSRSRAAKLVKLIPPKISLVIL